MSESRDAQVVTIRGRLSNIHAVLGERVVLVDAGTSKDVEKVFSVLAARGRKPSDVSLILLTHGHADHAGGAPELRSRTGAPIALSSLDEHMPARGRNDPLQPTGPGGRMLRRMVDIPMPSFTPDLEADANLPMADFGVDGRVQDLPGHTAGSVMLRLPAGAALVGDAIRGGYAGGRVLPQRPLRHYFAGDLELLSTSLRALLRDNPSVLHVGHGGPLDPRKVSRALSRLSA